MVGSDWELFKRGAVNGSFVHKVGSNCCIRTNLDYTEAEHGAKIYYLQS
ncbi:hypothetical protein SAMN04488002_1163 [Litoreibacter janthinus]|uniref:Uncharacterized protein n=1 Tax=Litoreibacter janthinus TaxID=670154 RepID=A0A1I6GAS7_9RHOB|nr:hypothetical protein SAMN04488002_1163 [Litoreibacter janthinus]